MTPAHEPMTPDQENPMTEPIPTAGSSTPSTSPSTSSTSPSSPPSTPPSTSPSAPPHARGRGWPRAALVAVLAACLLAIGGVAFGVTAARSGPTTPPTASTGPAAAGTGSGSSAAANGRTGAVCRNGQGKHPRIRGTIRSISGDTWRVQTAKRGDITVTIGSATKFGRKDAPAQRSAFTVGSRVVVVGPSQDGKVTARRVVVPQPQHGKQGKSGSRKAPSASASPSSTGATS